VAGDRGVQVGDNVAAFEHGPGGRADQQSGVVIDDAEDFDLPAGRERQCVMSACQTSLGRSGSR
jgi:hypothetical protein